MNITENTLVSMAYQLTVDGAVVDQASAEQPLEFIFGMGMLLPDFEAAINGKVAGDKFAFTLTPVQGYGEINADAIVELPKEIFMVDGVVAEDVLQVGNVLPMGDNQGNRMNGTITEIGEKVVIMDFNHPMAGKTLNFEGEIVAVAEATEADVAKYFGAANGGGCGCNCSSEGCEDGGCESAEGCSSEGCKCE